MSAAGESDSSAQKLVDDENVHYKEDILSRESLLLRTANQIDTMHPPSFRNQTHFLIISTTTTSTTTNIDDNKHRNPTSDNGMRPPVPVGVLLKFVLDVHPDETGWRVETTDMPTLQHNRRNRHLLFPADRKRWTHSKRLGSRLENFTEGCLIN